MFTESFTQSGNSCGAATLAIAAKQLGKLPTVDTPTVEKLYAQTSDPKLSVALGRTKTTDYYSTPENIMNTARKTLGLNVTLYVKKEIDNKTLPANIQTFKVNYVDRLSPTLVDTAGLKTALGATGYMQLLVYLDGDKNAMHWLLLQAENNAFNVYDTAFGKNYPLHSVDELNGLLGFNAPFKTGRDNNFYGIAILLH